MLIPNLRECKSRVAPVPYRLRSELASCRRMQDEVFVIENLSSLCLPSTFYFTKSPQFLRRDQDGLAALASGHFTIPCIYRLCLASKSAARLQMCMRFTHCPPDGFFHLLKSCRAQMIAAGPRHHNGLNSTTQSVASSLLIYPQPLSATRVQTLMHRLVRLWTWI